MKCPNCKQDMRLLGRVQSNKHYRIRRFYCDFCEIQETVFAEGVLDQEVKPNKAIDAIKKQYQKEQEARDF